MAYLILSWIKESVKIEPWWRNLTCDWGLEESAVYVCQSCYFIILSLYVLKWRCSYGFAYMITEICRAISLLDKYLMKLAAVFLWFCCKLYQLLLTFNIYEQLNINLIIRIFLLIILFLIAATYPTICCMGTYPSRSPSWSSLNYCECIPSNAWKVY